MRSLIISDIHGNRDALYAVLNDAYERYRYTEVFNLGDLVGYGPEPFEAWRDLKQEPVPPGGWLAGNHEWGLFDRLQQLDFRPQSIRILFEHKSVLRDHTKVIDHLIRLPVMSSPRPGIYLAHGAFESEGRRVVLQYPHNPYPLSPGLIISNFIQMESSTPEHILRYGVKDDTPPLLFISGHTHLPSLQRWDVKKELWKILPHMRPRSLGDLKSAPLMINPGSVGFPRDGNACASYVIVDWEQHRIHFRRSWYNVTRIRKKMRLEPYIELLGIKDFTPPLRCRRRRK